MKQFLRRGVPFAMSVLAACSAQVALAAPDAGAYVSDARNTWVQDRVGDRIGVVNMIMCVLGSMRGDAMVNQGTYLALIDMNKCQGRGDSSKSTSTSAGASNATNYTSAAVQATQASESDPLVMKAWLLEEDGGRKQTVYVYLTASEGKSAEHPNGVFEMYFCGTDESAPTTCGMKGSLQSAADGLRFYEEELDEHGNLQTTRLILNSDPDTDSGSGRISSSEGEYLFAYNSAQFCRDDGTTESCFDRATEAGEYSTWRYGTYNGDGSRLEVANPGFPVKFEYNETSGQYPGVKTFYGFWSFWGLWLPETALAKLSQGTLTRRVGDTDVPLSIEKHPGKLWKLSRAASTLDGMKNTSMMLWLPQGVSGLQGNTNYEVKWNGTALQAVASTVCGESGCSPQPLSPFIDLDAQDLRDVNIKALPVFFQAGGGNGMVSVPDAGDFAGGTDVFYRVREMVRPDDPDLHLDCVTQCLMSGSDLADAFTNNQQPYLGNWGPTTVLHSYTFSGGDLTHDGNANAPVDASGIAREAMGNYQWGVNSGAMINHADIDDVRCDSFGAPSPSGSHYCSNLVERAEVIYQWETGPNQWNQYFGATGVSIDPPKMLNLAAHYGGVSDPANNIFGGAAANYHGNNLQLQFSGFGELQGVPGSCVNPETNETAACSQNTRWVPAFNIQDGAAVSDGSHNYYVRYLERELRLSSISRNGGSPTLPSVSLTLPDASLIAIDARTEIDGVPGDVPSKPAVIDGTVQAGQ